MLADWQNNIGLACNVIKNVILRQTHTHTDTHRDMEEKKQMTKILNKKHNTEW